MKKFKSFVALILVLVLALGCFTACGNQAEQDAQTSEGEKLKIALVLPGKKDDVSFNQAMYRGATEYAEAHPDEVELKVVEGIYEVADIDPTLRDYADAGYDVVIGHGYQFSEPVNTVAAQYPEVMFLLGCGVGYHQGRFLRHRR